MRITERLATIAPNPTHPYFFVVIYLGWAWFFWGFIVLSGESVWEFPNVVLFYIGGLSPTVGGIVLTHRVGDGQGCVTSGTGPSIRDESALGGT